MKTPQFKAPSHCNEREKPSGGKGSKAIAAANEVQEDLDSGEPKVQLKMNSD
jgi:hypothetical protein